MGISKSNPELGYDPDSLFEPADKELYAAKHRGRSQVIVCDDSLPELPDSESTRRHLRFPCSKNLQGETIKALALPTPCVSLGHQRYIR